MLRRFSSAEPPALPFMLPPEMRRPPLPPEEDESGLFLPRLSPETNLRSGVLPRNGLIEFRSELSLGMEPLLDPALLPS